MSPSMLISRNTQAEPGTGVNVADATVHEALGATGMEQYRPQFRGRLASLISMRDGWDGPGSVRPDRAAVSLFWVAMRGLVDAQKRIGLGASRDGSVSIEWDADDTGYVAAVSEGHAHLMIFPADGSITERVVDATPEVIAAFALDGVLPDA